ncbi:oxygenase MpaB family protein [Adhaeribacter aquaticus]|uniref:oxygenase MpaB family protein n=1 Tax=Adhaeribacter aquaticus TaxID=299567 RepID=UPI0004791538|nr:oxygenase MpaB family protein [Adhaeribacter aquaticus]
MEFFVAKNSVVREIWGKSDTILFIFAGASAEFALNKAVDWLYFTGRLPADPLGRLFSTVAYARQIVFSGKEGAYQAIDKMRAIHAGVETNRGATIPDWAYRDVLFMLIHYSIASYEVLERKLTYPEKEEVFQVFNQVGTRMGIPGLPQTYSEWLIMRQGHLEKDLQHSNYTADLFKQYRKHLGALRFKLLTEAQILVVPERVNQLLALGQVSLLRPILPIYQVSQKIKLDGLLKALLLPSAYKNQIYDLDKRPG